MYTIQMLGRRVAGGDSTVCEVHDDKDLSFDNQYVRNGGAVPVWSLVLLGV
jgi:hypothetical protein